MLRSAVAGLALRRSSASLRLSAARLHSTTPASFSAADRIERHRTDEKDKEEAEKARRRRTQQSQGVSRGRQDDYFDTAVFLDLDMKPRGSSIDSTRTSSSTESSADVSRSSGGFWDRESSWSWGSGDSGGGDSCSGGGDCGGGD